MTDLKLELSPPWETYVNELKALFKHDAYVKVFYDRGAQTVKIYVDDVGKAEALGQLLRKEVSFGEVTLNIVVVPSNRVSIATVDNDNWAKAFRGNDALRCVRHVTYTPFACTYVIWTSKPVQFFNDNLRDYCGNTTMLVEDIAKDVLDNSLLDVMHCTEIVEDEQ